MDDRNPLSIVQNTNGQDDLANDFRSPSKETMESEVIYKDLLAKGKSAAAVGNLSESLEAYKKCYKMKQSEKILLRIKKIESALKEIADEEEDETDDWVQLDNGLIIYKQLVERLYPHQIEGVKWIYDLQQKKKKGGILADDMGLGKTIQVISALSAMFDMEVVQSVLLVLPLSLIPNWQREFEKWAPGIKIKSFYGATRERTKALEYAQRRPSVCITTYGLVITQWEQLSQTKWRREFKWDYIILDEGHKIKNPSKTTKGLHAIPSRNRLILTGTPIQNNLRELWALFDWVTQGTLLGTQKTFKTEYDTPITRARQRGASSAEIHLGNYMAESLRKIVDPFILRRTKSSVSAPKPGSGKADENQVAGGGNQPSFPNLKKKNDFVIWTYLSDVQEEIYRDFLAQESIKELLASKRSPLVYLTILKKICDHPRLLPRRACHQLGLEANDSLHEDDFHTDKGKECAANRIDNISDETLIQESGKLQFLLELLKCLRSEGHRTLIFSLSRKILNIIHRILINHKFKVMRLDGTISKISERELRVKKFQQDSSYDVFLLTTQVGGVGLTLTAADRVVIFDPSWNPATDAQAVDRIYRIGQDKNVVVYRLITCGTVEEKIYRRQIFKDSIIKQSTGDNKDPYRYFTNHELKELFQLEDTRNSMTQKQLQDLHLNQRCLEPKLEEHLAYLHTLPMFGVSDHDLMFSQEPDDVDSGEMNEHMDTVRNKVAEAQNRVELEAKAFTGTSTSVAEERWGDFDIKTKVSEPRVKEEEPVFQIEGLYDKFDSFVVEDDAVENIFNQSKISVKEEKDAPELESAMETIHISDSEDEESVSTKLPNAAVLNIQNEAIFVEDSPVRDLQNEVDAMEMLEIGESFVSDKNDDGRSTPGPEGLLDADISCIPIPQRSRESTFQVKNGDENPERLQLVEENQDALQEEGGKDSFLNSTSASDLLLNSDAEKDDVSEDEDAETPAPDKEAGKNITNDYHTDLLMNSDAEKDDVPKDEDAETLASDKEAGKNILNDYDDTDAPGLSKEDENVEDHKNQKQDESEEEEELLINDDMDLGLQNDAFETFSPLKENSMMSDVEETSALPNLEGQDEDGEDPVDDGSEIRLKLDDSEDERSLKESMNDSPKGFFLDEASIDASPVQSGNRKKKKRRLISNSDSDTEDEAVDGSKSDDSEGDEEDAASLKDFVVNDDKDVEEDQDEEDQDDDFPLFQIAKDGGAETMKDFIVDDDVEEDQDDDLPLFKSATDSPWCGINKNKPRRRSTAAKLPRIDTSDDSEEEDTTNYRDKADVSSEAENSKLSALELSFQSDEDLF